MKYELRYFAQMYLGFETLSSCEKWIMPSSISCILLGEIEKLEHFKFMKEYFLRGETSIKNLP